MPEPLSPAERLTDERVRQIAALGFEDVPPDGLPHLNTNRRLHNEKVALAREVLAHRAAVPSLGHEAGERELWARHSATDEQDACEVAERLFDVFPNAMVEVCRLLSSDPGEEGKWSVVMRRWPATPPGRSMPTGG